MKSYSTQGFSLIELMIAVAIVGILAAVALPSYQGYVTKGARAAAQTELLQLASLQEKIYLNSNAYTDSITLAYNGLPSTNATPGGLGRPTGLTPDGKYTLSITATTQTYTITATPVTGSTQASDGILSISEDGRKVWGTSTW